MLKDEERVVVEMSRSAATSLGHRTGDSAAGLAAHLLLPGSKTSAPPPLMHAPNRQQALQKEI